MAAMGLYLEWDQWESLIAAMAAPTTSGRFREHEGAAIEPFGSDGSGVMEGHALCPLPLAAGQGRSKSRASD
ncbi:hypothetical protein QE438_003233 [Pseudoxanthomonas sp. SORGH_AS 997]|uniref:Uncharacterized protein n=1 Tax=Pseudoxanthomonas winnipegensis TaxID=2480810 RepID=A0AAW8GDS6_9GAMM|nr:hypothetical protein [Pseudoxanthomonas winnipegensis]MDQ1133833.1 hypothetical protein [Pseudoxanthomonas winnipegensis]MDR6139929.1 hypothetical protein [Pseudoxanthomonas sp. SORGH_AS_0997]